MGDLQADLGLSEKPTRAALRELELAGLLKRKRNGRGLPNSYWLTLPGDPQNLPSEGSRTASAPDLFLKDVGEHRDEGAEAPSSPPAPITNRPRKIAYDALVAATAANPAEGGKIGQALKRIRTAAAEPLATLSSTEAQDAWLAGEIVKRARVYRERRPEWELTPTALASHWNRIPTWTSSSSKMSPEQIARLEDR